MPALSNHPSVDVVKMLVVGDTCEHGTAAELGGMKEILASTKLPTKVVIGNHDWTAQEDRKLYNQIWPDSINYTFEHHGWQFVGPLHGEGRRLQARVEVELLEDVLDVGADGMRTDVEDAADRLVAPALAEEREHLAFPQRQAVYGRLTDPVLSIEELAEHPGHSGPWLQLTVPHGVFDGACHGGRTASFQHHPECAGAHGVCCATFVPSDR